MERSLMGTELVSCISVSYTTGHGTPNSRSFLLFLPAACICLVWLGGDTMAMELPRCPI